MFQPSHQDNLKSTESNIKRHEDNIKFLKTQSNRLDESILDLHGIVFQTADRNAAFITEDETMKHILQQERSAAGVLCKIKAHNAIVYTNLPLTKDVVGIVATLARVDDDNLSRLLSEYLGLQTMLAIVCRTYEGVQALEKYDGECKINSSTGLHGLGYSIGRKIDGRFLVFCLEDLSPYAGEFVADDPQKKLALLKPTLPNGECPPGFLDFAVNMINLDNRNLFYVTADGHGLRETLFYTLFSHLQVYKTRAEMLSALPCITTGALSLDGGMIQKNGLFVLGNRKDVEVKFPIASRGSILPANYIQIEDKIRMLKCEQQNIAEDMQREQVLLDKAEAKLHKLRMSSVSFSYTKLGPSKAGTAREKFGKL